MAHYETKVDPNGSGPLDQVEAYVDDEGVVYFPGDEGYVEKAAEPEEGSGAPEEGGEVEGATVDPTASHGDAKTPLEIASEIDE